MSKTPRPTLFVVIGLMVLFLPLFVGAADKAWGQTHDSDPADFGRKPTATAKPAQAPNPSSAASDSYDSTDYPYYYGPSPTYVSSPKANGNLDVVARGLGIAPKLPDGNYVEVTPDMLVGATVGWTTETTTGFEETVQTSGSTIETFQASYWGGMEGVSHSLTLHLTKPVTITTPLKMERVEVTRLVGQTSWPSTTGTQWVAIGTAPNPQVPVSVTITFR